jgi:sugar lactone lactonase YvrE
MRKLFIIGAVVSALTLTVGVLDASGKPRPKLKKGVYAAHASPRPGVASSPAGEPGPPTLLTAQAGGSGSAVGPGGALYVTDGPGGRLLRVDPKTGAVTTFASGLPKSIVGIGGAIDIAFLGRTAYVLVTLVGPDVGGSHAVGVYRVDGPSSTAVVADVGAFSLSHPPSTDFFVPTGVQYALETFRGGFLVTDGHHNRVLRVRLDGTVSELIAFGNIVPTGLETRGKTVYMAEAGPVPHLPEDGRVVRFRPGDADATEVASGGRLLVDVELGRGRSLFALAQGVFAVGSPEGSPAMPNTGQLLRVDHGGTFTVVADGLDRPTSLEIVGDTAFVTTFGGEIWKIERVSSRPSSSAEGSGAILPPEARVKGRSLAQWHRAFFKWTSAIPTDGPQPHPGLTEGAVDCSYEQRGRVWFLESGGVERSCSIPPGTLLYVPVNFWFCLLEVDGIPIADCEEEGDPYLEESVATLTVDGRTIDLGAWRTETGAFTTKLADANIWEFLFGAELGRTTELASDGMGALVLLAGGPHTVAAGVTFDFDGDGSAETFETTYEIEVAGGAGAGAAQPAEAAGRR